MLRKLVPIDKKSMFPINFAFYYYIDKYISFNAFKNLMQNRWNVSTTFSQMLVFFQGSLSPFRSFLQINISFPILFYVERM